MVDMAILGIGYGENGQAPYLMLSPYGKETVIGFRVTPIEAVAIESAYSEDDVFTVSSTLTAAAIAGGNAHPTDADKFKPIIQREQNEALRQSFYSVQMFGLFIQTIEKMHGRLTAVELHGESLLTLSAQLVLSSPSGPVRQSCRPALGIGLAMRCRAAIWADERIAVLAEDADKGCEFLDHASKLSIKGALNLKNNFSNVNNMGNLFELADEEDILPAPSAPEPEKPAPKIAVATVTVKPKDSGQDEKKETPEPPETLASILKVSLVRMEPSSKSTLEVLSESTEMPSSTPSSFHQEKSDEYWEALLKKMKPETKEPM